MRGLLGFLLAYALLALNGAHAADIHLRLAQKNVGDQIKVTVSNASAVGVTLTGVELAFSRQRYTYTNPINIPAGGKTTLTFQVQLPELPGSYPQIARVYYRNDGQIFSLLNVGLLHHQEHRVLNDPARLELPKLYHTGHVHLFTPRAQNWRLALPTELQPSHTVRGNTYLGQTLQAQHAGFTMRYPIFAVQTRVIDGRHYAQIISAKLFVDNRAPTGRGRLPADFLLFAALLGLLVFAALNWHQAAQTRAKVAWSKYAARLFWASAAYWLLQNGDQLALAASGFCYRQTWLHLDVFIDWFGLPNPLAHSLAALAEHLRGKHYQYFFAWFIDFYWLFIVLACLPYAYWRDQQSALAKDKYAAALQWLVQPHKHWQHNPAADAPAYQKRISPARLGFLLLAVKLFFLPYLASWVINNIIHQGNLTDGLAWNFVQINAYLMATLILTDTLVFAVGYAFESHEMKNRIRSVEPTWLGWIVCLWCYPPFNTFSFVPFDQAWFNIHWDIPGWAEPIPLVIVTLCWAVFVWASVALGFKASNLTNRGIVRHGPYRYCRHPAYAAKVLAWTVQGVLLGQYFIGLLVAFMVIYGLRAWTEERHLSLDPDYLAYKKVVPYWFIPKVF